VARFLLGRCVTALISILGVLTIVFVIMRLSGDPTLLLVPESAGREQIELLRHQLGFDQPLLKQYADYLWMVARLDFGASYVQRIPVLTIIGSRLPYTLWLAGAALAFAVIVGLTVGIASAARRGGWLERVLTPIILVGQSLPTFWSGILLILFFAVQLRWLPASGADEPVSVIMPALALGGLSMATFARVARTAVLEELSKDYVRAAKAKGIGEWRVMFAHVLRNAAIPIITVTALEIANLLGGAVIVETVFAWPGVGQLALQSITMRDFLVAQAVVLLASVSYVLLNLVADVLYSAVDPRIRLGARRD
jgi:peptide/nickel transport system permease protein